MSIEQVFEQNIIAKYIHAAATTVLFYDSILSLPREVALVWSRGLTGFTLLYVTNRYSAILHRLFTILQSMRWGQTLELFRPHLVFDVFSWSAIATFSAFRMYALTGRRMWLSVVTMLLGLVLPAVDLYVRAISTPNIRSPFAGCGADAAITLGTYRIRKLIRANCHVCLSADWIEVATSARATTLLTDLLVVIVTLRQTIGVYSSGDLNGPSLSSILLRDGSIYFIVLFLFNLFDIVLLQVAINGATADVVTVLSVILVAGFLLDLRETDGTNQTTSGTAMSSFAFASRSGVEDLDVPMAREAVCDL
ncbi:hypothetical protein C8Q76DRAFT_795254 [Earliella scabrosa]|nr:hypothetical protein C8Q76DRAFT_795254 [Earliella scabrosa]